MEAPTFAGVGDATCANKWSSAIDGGEPGFMTISPGDDSASEEPSKRLSGVIRRAGVP